MYHINLKEKRSVENMSLSKLFEKEDNAYELGSILEEFQHLKERLEAVASKADNRVKDIDMEIGQLEAQAFAETENRDRALKVAKNVAKVFDV